MTLGFVDERHDQITTQNFWRWIQKPKKWYSIFFHIFFQQPHHFNSYFNLITLRAISISDSNTQWDNIDQKDEVVATDVWGTENNDNPWTVEPASDENNDWPAAQGWDQGKLKYSCLDTRILFL